MTEAAQNVATEAYVGTNEETRAVMSQVAEGVARVAEERVRWEVAVAEAESRQYSERNGHVPVDERDADYSHKFRPDKCSRSDAAS